MNEYSFTNRLKNLKDDDKLFELEATFNSIYDQVSSDKQEGKIVEKGMAWSLPQIFVAFMANTLQLENLSAKVIPWPEFKKQVYDFYDHKIFNSPEINGSLNNSYLCM